MHTLKKYTEKIVHKLFVVALCVVAIFGIAPHAHAEDDYGTYTTDPIDYGTYTTSPVDYGTYTAGPVDYGMYTTSPDYGTYTTSPDYGTYTTSPEPDYGMYTTSPVDYGTYTTSPIDTYTQPYTTADAYVPPDYGTYTTSPVYDYGTFTTSPLVYASGYDYYPAYSYGYGSYDYYYPSSGSYPSTSYYPTYTPAVYAKSKPEVYKPYVAPTYTGGTGSGHTDTCVGTNNCNTTYNNPTPVIPTNPVTPVIIDNNNTNTNTNNNTNNNVITINTPAPTVTTVVKERERSRADYRQPVYYQPPTYNSTPYVSLSAVPYTGLELGFYGTVIYWSVLVLWCLFVAYMIVVKQAHIKIARWFKTFLFGGTAVVAATEVVAPTKREVAHAPTQTLDKTDDFIMAQVLRRA